MSYKYDDPKTNALAKRLFDTYTAKDQFNASRIILSEIDKKVTFVGSQMEKAFLRSLGGGVSATGIPKSSARKYSRGSVTSKRSIATTEVDYESWLATSTDEGAFVSFQSEAIEAVNDNLKNNLERQLVRNDATGSGVLAVGAAANTAVTTNGDGDYVVSLDAADTYFPATFECFEEGHIINVNSETTDLEVIEVSVTVQDDGYAEGVLTLRGGSSRLDTLISGTNGFDATDSFYMQKSKDAEMIGALGVLTATDGDTLYNVEVGRRFKATQIPAGGASITADILNNAIATVELNAGEEPTHILVHPRQYTNIMSFLEDKKRYELRSKAKKNADVGMATIHYEGASGLIPIVKSRFMDSDKIYLLNMKSKYTCLNMRPEGIHLQQKDGNVWHRLEASDSLQARLAVYGEMFMNPNKQGIITNLSLAPAS